MAMKVVRSESIGFDLITQAVISFMFSEPKMPPILPKIYRKMKTRKLGTSQEMFGFGYKLWKWN